MQTQPYILTQLIPFNASRFDALMSYLSHEVYGRPVTIMEAVKHHVMADVFHVLDQGHQIIGGELQPWEYGPVVVPAYNRLKTLDHRFCESPNGFSSPEYDLFHGENTGFQSRHPFDADDTSPSELRAMSKAIELLKPMSTSAMYKFFHSDGTFMGRAYNLAVKEGRALSWTDIIDSHDAIHGTDHANLKRRLISYK